MNQQSSAEKSPADMIDTIDISMILILMVAWYFEIMVLSFSALTDSLEFELKKDKIGQVFLF